MKNIVIIGKVIDAYGIKGWVKVRSFTETPKNFTQYINQFISANQKDWETITIKDMKVQGENVLIDLGYLDRNEAIKHATWDVLVWIDDDERTKNDQWLLYITKPILEKKYFKF